MRTRWLRYGAGRGLAYGYRLDCHTVRSTATYIYRRTDPRTYQVVEVAPAVGLPADLTQNLYDDAVRICKGAGYVNAGTVEFLVDPKTWKHYFIEVNPRIQVGHTHARTHARTHAHAHSHTHKYLCMHTL